MPAPGPRLLSLTDDLLIDILVLLDEEARIKVLPLVSKRFNELLRHPVACWRQVVLPELRGGDEETEAARLAGFGGWARPRVSATQDLRINTGSNLSKKENRSWVEVLLARCRQLRRLEVRVRHFLDVGALLPSALQAALAPSLRELHLLAEEGMTGLRLARLSSLQHLNVVVDAEPAESFNAASSLPPTLTWLGLTPCPALEAPDGGEYHARIPDCVLRLPDLRFLDISESIGLVGLEAALPRLTALTGLALDHADLPALPSQLSLMRRVRLLSLHGVISMTAEHVDWSPLAALQQLRVLSISECHQLRTVPPAVAGLTRLKALHMERSALQSLPDDLHLPHLLMLSIDWRVLLASHHVLPRQPSLRHLLLGSMLSRVLPFMEGAVGGDAAQALAVLPSLARCAALRTLTVLVYNSPEATVSPGIAALMLQAGRACPRLTLEAQDSTTFFLTDSEHLADPEPGEEDGGGIGSAAAG